jgi:hypothetical protein
MHRLPQAMAGHIQAKESWSIMCAAGIWTWQVLVVLGRVAPLYVISIRAYTRCDCKLFYRQFISASNVRGFLPELGVHNGLVAPQLARLSNGSTAHKRSSRCFPTPTPEDTICHSLATSKYYSITTVIAVLTRGAPGNWSRRVEFRTFQEEWILQMLRRVEIHSKKYSLFKKSSLKEYDEFNSLSEWHEHPVWTLSGGNVPAGSTLLSTPAAQTRDCK